MSNKLIEGNDLLRFVEKASIHINEISAATEKRKKDNILHLVQLLNLWRRELI